MCDSSAVKETDYSIQTAFVGSMLHMWLDGISHCTDIKFPTQDSYEFDMEYFRSIILPFGLLVYFLLGDHYNSFTDTSKRTFYAGLIVRRSLF